MAVIEKYFLLFMLYSFLGWCMETTLVSLQNKKFINRGFLIGPYCPIYGYGSLFIVLVLGRWSYNPVMLFVTSIIGCGALEYFTSWIMEVVFKARWWDYSNRKFNLNGRVCLRNLIAFGVLGLVINYILNPWLLQVVDKVQLLGLQWISIIIACIYVIDNVISFIVISGFRKTTKQVNRKERTDDTEQITQRVRAILSQKSFLHRRFVNAYPKLQAIQIKIKEIKNKIEDATNEAKDVVAEKTGEIKNRIENATNEAKDVINEKFEKNTRKVKVRLYLGKRYIRTKFRGKKFGK